MVCSRREGVRRNAGRQVGRRANKDIHRFSNTEANTYYLARAVCVMVVKDGFDAVRFQPVRMSGRACRDWDHIDTNNKQKPKRLEVSVLPASFVFIVCQQVLCPLCVKERRGEDGHRQGGGGGALIISHSLSS
jgi:hypothetical protein